MNKTVEERLERLETYIKWCIERIEVLSVGIKEIKNALGLNR